MSDIAIRVENLSKLYRIGALQQRHDTLRDALSGVFRRGHSSAAANELWALKDVSFEVRRGEVVGIIGRNGAGKSTLLKILSRITEPTGGRAEIHGRVGSLLEVGTGFHPELTGRENIYLNGAILGMRRGEIQRRFDEIVAFAEIEKFLDTPVKRYSSGMYVRLAFAVAAHLEPEILLVDEVLAVGDAQFQKKCLGKMGDVAQAGRTVLFVSHNMIALRSLCPRAILLSGGVLINTGSSGDVIAAYLETGLTQTLEREWARPEDAPGTEAFKLRRLAIISNGSLSTEAIGREDEFRVEVEYWQLSSAKTNVNLRFYVDTQVMAFTTPSSSDPGWSYTASQTGLRRATCCVPANLLNTGLHRIELLAVQNEKVILQLEDALAFDIVETEARDGSWYGKWPGVVRPKFVWTNEHLG